MNQRLRGIAVVAALALGACAMALTILPACAATRPAGIARSIPAAGPKRVAAFIRHSFSVRPHEATRAGIHGADGLLVPVTEALIDSERAWVADFAAAGDPAPALARGATSEASLEAALLDARIRRIRLDLDELRPFEVDPGAYRPLVDGSIRDLLFVSTGPLSTRLRYIARRLEHVPEVLRAAQVNLDHPSITATETAIEAYGRTLELYRRDLPWFARDLRDATVLADLSEADTLATHALLGFIEWLQVDVRMRSTGTVSIGADRYARVLTAETATSVTLDQVAQRVQGELQRSRARRDSIAGVVRFAGGEDTALVARRIATADSAAAVAVARALRRPPGNRARWRARAALGPASALDAWAEHVAGRTFDADTTAPARRLAAESRRLGRRARLAAVIDIHAHAATVDDAAAMIASRAGVDSATARGLAVRAALEPGSAVAALHLLDYAALRDEAGARLGARFDPRAFERALTAEAPSPPAAAGNLVLRRLGVK